MTNKLGISGAGISPLLFALIRETCAAPVLFAMLVCARRARDADDAASTAESDTTSGSAERPSRRALLRLLPGVFIFLDQLCSLTGNMLAGPISASAWQPSQVVFTALISIGAGMERPTTGKAAGVVLTVTGALCLVLLGGSGDDSSASPNRALGQAFLFCNCLASSLEVVTWRMLLRDATSPLAHLAVMAESYMVAAVLMAVACLSVSCSSGAVRFFCPRCNGDPWHLPASALWAVAYSVVVQTLLGYCAQAWALRYAESSTAAVYSTTQPIVAAVVTCVMLGVGFNPGGALDWPGEEMVGALLVIFGLLAVVRSEASGRGEGLLRRTE